VAAFFTTLHMKFFRVGGSVRDALLGLPVNDIDYVVIGATPEQMVAAGFTPVGKDFPVFLHPDTRSEYALARTERKSAPGYRGFVFHCSPDVTIEQDLQRRDLTINAMAIAVEDVEGTGKEDYSKIIDPFGGQRDLETRIFRHVSDAFIEDPVRILRVARFAARFSTFTVAPETLRLMRKMVESGEVDALVPERVWQEIARGLMEQQPACMFDVLRDVGALVRIMPEIDAMSACTTSGDARIKQVVNYAAQLEFSLAVRWAAMLAATASHASGTIDKLSDSVSPSVLRSISLLAAQLCTHLKVPTEVRDVTLQVLREHVVVEQALHLTPESMVQLFERCDAFRRPARFTQILQVVRSLHSENSDFLQQSYLEQALEAARAIPSGEIARAAMLDLPNHPQQIAMAISQARANAIRNQCGI
jgi:tRNA nucleotidyltransferase (CCA-adding enzyme)